MEGRRRHLLSACGRPRALRPFPRSAGRGGHSSWPPSVICVQGNRVKRGTAAGGTLGGMRGQCAGLPPSVIAPCHGNERSDAAIPRPLSPYSLRPSPQQRTRQGKKSRLTQITRIKKRIARKGSYGASRNIIAGALMIDPPLPRPRHDGVGVAEESIISIVDIIGGKARRSLTQISSR